MKTLFALISLLLCATTNQVQCHPVQDAFPQIKTTPAYKTPTGETRTLSCHLPPPHSPKSPKISLSTADSSYNDCAQCTKTTPKSIASLFGHIIPVLAALGTVVHHATSNS